MSDILRKVRQTSGSTQRGEKVNTSVGVCELNDHNQAKRKDSQTRLFGDVSIVSSIDVGSNTNGNKLTLF